MLEYDKVDISEGIVANKTNLSKECDICGYWYFKDNRFQVWTMVMVVMI